MTAYEIATYGDSHELTATWVIVLKDVSHVLLVSYSALNPLAYCGELLWSMVKNKICRCPCKCTEASNVHSEVVQMKSIGYTATCNNTSDLDAQSRILSGIGPSSSKESNRTFTGLNTLQTTYHGNGQGNENQTPELV